MADLYSFEEDQDSIEESENPLKKVRAYAKRLEKKVQELEAQNQELVQFREQTERTVKVQELGKAFSEFGLPPKSAELFLAVKAEVDPTEDNVKAFAQEYGIPIQKLEPEKDGEKPLETSSGFAPVEAGEAPGPGRKIYEADEWKALYNQRPNDAIQILREGRVKLIDSIDATPPQ